MRLCVCVCVFCDDDDDDGGGGDDDCSLSPSTAALSFDARWKRVDVEMTAGGGAW